MDWWDKGADTVSYGDINEGSTKSDVRIRNIKNGLNSIKVTFRSWLGVKVIDFFLVEGGFICSNQVRL